MDCLLEAFFLKNGLGIGATPKVATAVKRGGWSESGMAEKPDLNEEKGTPGKQKTSNKLRESYNRKFPKLREGMV